MPAIVSVGDQICLQSRKFLKHLESDCLESKSYLKKIEIAGIYGPQQIRLQAYMVPIETEIAGIFGPLLNQDCRHNRSPYSLKFNFRSQKTLSEL